MSWKDKLQEAANVAAENKEERKNKKKGRRKKRKGKGARKGGAFERNLSKQFSLWWSDGKNDNIFWRTQNSGGRATQRTKKGKKTINNYGDMKDEDPIGKLLTKLFYFEFKTGYKDATLEDLLYKPTKAKNTWRSWIEKAQREHSQSSKTWMLVVKKKGKPELIAMNKTLFFFLIKGQKTKTPCFVFAKANRLNRNEAIIILPLKTFFDKVKVDRVREVAKMKHIPGLDDVEKGSN